MFKSDIEIARENEMNPICDIAEEAGFLQDEIEMYGRYKAKICNEAFQRLKNKEDGKLILVTAITPTPAGEGKTTTTVGLADGMRKIGKNVMVALREPSMGPVFGMKGGAAGGGYAQIVPMEDINLHFTGDMHAISAANNLLAAMIDNHIMQGNQLDIDVRQISWKRCVDMNDRQLRNITCGLGGKTNGVPREDGFEITVASEVMAILCLAEDIDDLKEKLGNIVIGQSRAGHEIKARDLKAHGAMAVLLKDAIKPNLVQTLEKTPAIVHGGPFGNIAHGCNSVRGTKLALKIADYVVTEAGFAADLGAEKFLDIKCRKAGIEPDAAVIVATVRALKNHGGVTKDKLGEENLEALRRGMPNLMRHIDNMKNVYGLPCVVAINAFPTDTERELDLVREECEKLGVNVALSTVWADGGKGGVELANEVVKLCEEKKNFAFAYPTDMSLKDKIRTVAQKIYRADDVDFDVKAEKELERLESLGYGNLPICVAKTQYSFSDKPELICAPSGFNIGVRRVKLSAGAGFVVVYTGEIMTMPGLPKKPSAENIDIIDGEVEGLF